MFWVRVVTPANAVFFAKARVFSREKKVALTFRSVFHSMSLNFVFD